MKQTREERLTDLQVRRLRLEESIRVLRAELDKITLELASG